MAHREQAPYRPHDPQEVRELVEALNAHRQGGKQKGGFSCKRNTFTLPSRRTIDSWKMQDWDYKKPNLPTYARGLFTYVNNKKEHEIAVRGYDKFFNHGEIRKTEWRNVEQHTRGPYELSVKENGCIIFIAGLDDGSLLVCSKHSTGARSDVPLSHAQAGERWIERHLKSVGKTKEQLATRLREMNATAVGELCDDEFEEHVLAYDPDTAGIYLHGINLNIPEFATYPGHLVDEFAAEWGFKKTMYVMEDDIKKVKSFLDGVAETGVYQGRETEGFVIRCQARETADAPFGDWFFKYKFEEPYLMYRQWRECTKAIIGNRTPRYKKHKKITEEYLLYARRRFAREPGLSKLYNQNHGIIQLRNDFLAERGLKGSDIIRQEIEAGDEAPGNLDVTRNVILVPVATIGCGKTTVALALVKLFGWGHVQNDNIQGKGNRPTRFATAVTNAVSGFNVCIADRNNHQKRERAQIIEDVAKVIPDVKFVALHWVHDRGNYDQIRRALQHRVLSRGDNHQTIQAGSKDPSEIIGIMDGFMHRFQPVDTNEEPDDRFDLVIDLDVTADSRENLETIVSRLNTEFPKLFSDEMPSSNVLDDAIDAALNEYSPDIKHDLSFKDNKKKHAISSGPQNNGSHSKPKPPRLEFFAVRLNSQRVNAVLAAVFRDQDPVTAKFFRQLDGMRRIQSEFHVTLIHKASAKEHPTVWERLVALHSPIYEQSVNQPSGNSTAPPSEPELGKCNVQLERLVWNERVMCFVVRLSSDGDTKYETVNPLAHVTVGTANQGIKPKESNDLLAQWLELGSGGDTGISELTVKGTAVLEGSVRGVLSRF